jgi:DNA-nicking Smr family endonuclease
VSKDDPRRRLSDDEVALWVEVARSVKARRGATLPRHDAKPAPAPTMKSARPMHSPPAPAPHRPSLPPLAPIERRMRRNLDRGRHGADGVIDLHGMTQAQAHGALRGFLVHSQSLGARVVIVVTGKGGRKPDDEWGDERGVLRRTVPHWLGAPDMRALVVGFEEAGPAQGGVGALYVRLRRRDRGERAP